MTEFVNSLSGLVAALTALVIGLPALIKALRELIKTFGDGSLWTTRRVVMTLALSVVAVGIGSFILGSRWSSRTPEAPRAEILSPAPGSAVPALVAVRGTATAVPEGSRVWLVVNPLKDTGWWPQGGPLVPVPPLGDWQQSVSLGGAVGQRFQIAVVLASADASREFERYLEEGSRTGQYPGRPLPPGTLPLLAIEVVKAGS